MLIDPWLEGAATIVLPAFHQAQLADEPVALQALPKLDALVLALPYPDHTQAATLRRLPRDLPVVAPPIAAWLAWLEGGLRDFRPIRGAGLAGGEADVGRVRVTYARGGWFDPTHNVLLFRGLDSGDTVLYCPHGMILGGHGEARISEALRGPPDVLLCSFTHLDLPGWLGGVANLGEQAAVDVIRRFAPRFVTRTHDGVNPDCGFIAAQTTTTRCPDVSAAVAGLSEVVTLGIGDRWSLGGRVESVV